MSCPSGRSVGASSSMRPFSTRAFSANVEKIPRFALLRCAEKAVGALTQRPCGAAHSSASCRSKRPFATFSDPLRHGSAALA